VRLVRGRLSDEDMAKAFAAIDICLINQASTLNSGTALLALSMDTPVIAPEVGTLPELAQAVGPAWMALMEPPLGGAGLRRALDRLAGPRPARCAPLDRLSPEVLSLQLLEAFREAISSRQRSRPPERYSMDSIGVGQRGARHDSEDHSPGDG
jgi:hypothetical protein